MRMGPIDSALGGFNQVIMIVMCKVMIVMCKVMIVMCKVNELFYYGGFNQVIMIVMCKVMNYSTVDLPPFQNSHSIYSVMLGQQ